MEKIRGSLLSIQLCKGQISFFVILQLTWPISSTPSLLEIQKYNLNPPPFAYQHPITDISLKENDPYKTHLICASKSKIASGPLKKFINP